MAILSDYDSMNVMLGGEDTNSIEKDLANAINGSVSHRTFSSYWKCITSE